MILRPLTVRVQQDILAINQDSLGKAATTFTPSGQAKPISGQLYPFWAGTLSDGVVVALVAPNGAQTLSVNFADVPGLGSGTWSWKELLSGKTGSGASVSASLSSHDVAVYKVTKSGGSSGGSSTLVTTSSRAASSTSKATTQPTGGACVAKYAQCGGSGWTGSTACCSGSTCKASNECEFDLLRATPDATRLTRADYSQCL